jgi:hypothetical protein
MPPVGRMVLVSLLVLGCLPADPPGFRRDAGAARPGSEKRADGGKKKLPPAASSRDLPVVDAGPLIDEPWSDDFDRAALGSDWNPTSDAWHVVDGRLCVKGARNHPAWLRRRLPKNARIEFGATSSSPDGDIKVEAWGDGKSAATGTTYDDATSYILVLGGWRNSLHVLARLDEHASSRKELRLVPGSEDPRNQPLVEGKNYHVEIERVDGRTVRFSIDDTEIHSFEDPKPLKGPGHEFFAFNDWDVPVCFDDLLITPLED